LFKKLKEDYSKKLGLESAYLYDPESKTDPARIYIMTGRKFDVNKVAKLQDRFAAWEKLGYKVTISYESRSPPESSTKGENGEGYYRVMISPIEVYKSIKDFDNNEEASKLWNNSINVDSDGQLVFPVKCLKIDQEVKIIDTLALELFGLPFESG